MFEIERYSDNKKQEWDAFVDSSKNGTFMLKRGYVDYHRERFVDCSLLFYLKGKLWGVFAGNVEGDVWYGHKGLTYGGLVMSEKCVGGDVMRAFEELNEWLRELDVKKVVYKAIPHIYSNMASEEDLYAVWRCGGKLVARGLSSCIDLKKPLKWRQTRRTALNKARSEGVRVEISSEIGDFWDVLQKNLLDKHGVKPVHSREEMELLMGRFPENIVLYQAMNADGRILGGMLIYRYERVIHSQYISATDEGKRCGAIDAIMHEVLKQDAQYFDFGVSTENGGLYLNESLLFQKEGFGGRGICYDTYEYSIS